MYQIIQGSLCSAHMLYVLLDGIPEAYHRWV